MGQPPAAKRDQQGHVIYDLSGDQALADNGDEAAEKRLQTKRLLTLRQMCRRSTRD